jgi:hypothetical protein
MEPRRRKASKVSACEPARAAIIARKECLGGQSIAVQRSGAANRPLRPPLAGTRRDLWLPILLKRCDFSLETGRYLAKIDSNAAPRRHRDDHRHGTAGLRFSARLQDPRHVNGRQLLSGRHAAPAIVVAAGPLEAGPSDLREIEARTDQRRPQRPEIGRPVRQLIDVAA